MCFTSSTSAKCFPLRTSFIWGNKPKKVAQTEIGRRGGWDTGRAGQFGSKTVEHSAWCGQVCPQTTRHEMGKRVERVFTKDPVKPNAASHNNASGCSDTGGLLEHSPSEESLDYKEPALQMVIAVFWRVSPLVVILYRTDDINKPRKGSF